MKQSKFLSVFFLLVGLSFFSKSDAICGKVDVAAALVDLDILESGKTIKTLHMKGVKADATIAVYQGLSIKPSFLWCQGHGVLNSGSLAVGYYLPLFEKLKFLPNVGVTWSYLHTRYDIPEVELFHLKERFRSTTPFVGLEVYYSITKKLSLFAIYQYGWARTHTKIRTKREDKTGLHPGAIALGLTDKNQTDKSHSCGPNYGIGLDYCFDDHWSVNIAFGYNITLSHEKHGLRGKGGKLGVGYYF